MQAGGVALLDPITRQRRLETILVQPDREGEIAQIFLEDGHPPCDPVDHYFLKLASYEACMTSK